jgi:ethanolamine transporter EutH
MYSVVLGSMLGPTISFNISVGLLMMRDGHRICFAYGTLVGTVVGGLATSSGC